MKKRLSVTLLIAALTAASANSAQDLARYGDDGLRAELAAIAEADTALLVPMRDGVGLSTNIWRPKGAKGPLPTILWKTPYNEHVLRGSTARFAAEAVRNGYAFIVQNERGRYFSQGKYEILGYPQTDENPRLDGPHWRYWWSSFGPYYVYWAKGAVSKIEGHSETVGHMTYKGK